MQRVVTGRYSVIQRDDQNERLVDLVDDATGSKATIVPGIGAQCRRFVWSEGGRPIDVLVPPPDLTVLKDDPVHYGNPILFPFPNRIKGGAFEFDGRKVSLPQNEPDRANAIHGLVINRPWQVADVGSSPTDGAWVTCRLESRSFPDLEEVFPFPFAISYTYRLRDGRLESDVEALNTGLTRMPMGFGLHPWFPLPLTDDGTRGACRLRASVSRVWELGDLVPTGHIVDAPEKRRLEKGVEIGDLEFDDVYTGLNEGLAPDAMSESAYTDPGTGVEIVVRADGTFRELVVYSPQHRKVVCLEPYTCTTDAFNLAARNIDGGMIVLDPGEKWTGRVAYVPRLTGPITFSQDQSTS